MQYALNLPIYVEETIKRRKSVLIDTSIWIRLSDGKTPEATNLRDKLLRLCHAEKIFCPLTAPTIWELRKQVGESLQRTAKLMEELSLNVTFRDLDEIFENEVMNFLNYLLHGELHPLTQQQIFGPLLSYLTPAFEIKPGPYSSTFQGKIFYEHLEGLVSGMSLTSFISLVGDQTLPEPTEKMTYQASNRRRREFAKESKSKMHRIEQEQVARSVLIPKLNHHLAKLLPDQQCRVVARMEALPKSKEYGSVLEHSLKFMPALSAYVEILTVSGYDTNRKDSPNDFYDREILVYGLSYSSCFAAEDRWVSGLIKLCRQNNFSGGLGFIGSLASLSEYACAAMIIVSATAWWAMPTLQIQAVDFPTFVGWALPTTPYRLAAFGPNDDQGLLALWRRKSNKPMQGTHFSLVPRKKSTPDGRR